MEWLEWDENKIVEWGKIYCPMINEWAMTYYPKGCMPYNTVTAPFLDEDGDICYFEYDHDEDTWLDEVIFFCEYLDFNGVR